MYILKAKKVRIQEVCWLENWSFETEMWFLKGSKYSIHEPSGLVASVVRALN